MYRYLLVLLCPGVAPAPQVSDSDITYVRLQPPSEAPTAPTHFRESRIENIPLTIPGNVTSRRSFENSTEEKNLGADRPSTIYLADDDTFLTESSDLSETVILPDGEDRTFADVTNLSERSERTDIADGTELVERTAIPEDSDRTTIPDTEVSKNGVSVRTNIPEADFPDTTGLPDRTALTERSELPEGNLSSALPDTPDKTDIGDELLEAHGSDVSDTLPSETYQSERRGRTYESGETTETSQEVTERYEEDPPRVYEDVVEIRPPKTRTLPKYVPKLSYIPKPRPFVAFSTNAIEKAGKRRFRSNCRCEKIWNCPKLQISVPRCPNEYFLCCF